MATPGSPYPTRPDRDFVEHLFDNREFQARLEASVRPFRTLSTVLGVFGVSAVAIFTYAGNKVHENLRVLEDKTAKLGELTARLQQDAQQRMAEVERTAAQVAGRAERASLDAEKHASSLSAQSGALTQSTTMVMGVIARMSDSLEASRKDLDSAMHDMRSRAQQFSDTQSQQAAEQKKIQAAQENLREAQKGIDALRLQLGNDVARSMKDIETLRATAGELAKSKTLELVSLRAESKALARLHHVQDSGAGLQPVNYNLHFSTGKLKPLVVALQVNDDQPVTYRDVETDKRNPDRKAYCICGTPFMFRVENYVQEILMHDFVTLKVLDRTSRCAPPPEVAACR